MTKPIVVGVDGSPRALSAVVWAAAEAVYRDAPLRIVNAFLPWPAQDSPLRLPPPSRRPRLEAWARTLAEQVVRRAAVVARAGAPIDPATVDPTALDPATDDTVGDGTAGSGTTAVETVALEGEPAEVLRGLADAAEIVVVGSRGRGGFSGLPLGSVGRRLSGHLACPLVVVREAPPMTHGEIVAGVDGAADSGPVLDFAFDEATRRGVRLRALHAWTHPVSRAPGDMLPLVFDVDAVGQEEARLLAETLAGWRTRYPDVDVVADVARAPAAKALIGASASADMIIVGPRHPRIRDAVLGSVAHAVLHHAYCPVAVVGTTARHQLSEGRASRRW